MKISLCIQSYLLFAVTLATNHAVLASSSTSSKNSLRASPTTTTTTTILDQGCPIPANWNCPTIRAPVDCNGGCLYSNYCFARAAGIDVASLSCQETDSNGPFNAPNTDNTNNNDNNNPLACPMPSDWNCPTIRSPVDWNGCLYSNSCFSRAAGIDDFSCPSSDSNGPFNAPDYPQPEDPLPLLCPKPADWNCPTIRDPVDCADGCRYSNSCYARVAGIDEFSWYKTDSNGPFNAPNEVSK